MLIVFTASGFAGLIYESIWSHYLKLFLGHAAYAQTLVLAIFMGGMAIGAWGASRMSSRFGDLLLAYAVIEALIGVSSLVFHDVFVAVTELAFERVIPSLGSPAAVYAFKWTLAAVLILPQSVLLGATFPVMTGGVLRLRPERAGYVVAMLYFTNSLGAAAGVLASGFYFIAAAGLPGTLVAAGMVNLAVAVAAILLRKVAREGGAEQVAPAPAAPVPAVPRLKLLLVVAALTGASSFMYEIGWIRMLSLVLGSSTHSFELMLSAFILGLAFGGLAIRRWIDLSDPLRLLGWVQVAMGIAALATLPVYASSFQIMQNAMRALAPTEGGYTAFHIVSHAICLAVMFPAAFCAGMTLPLITTALLRGGAGERAIGQVYAANTAGAIVGVAVAVHAGIVFLGLKGLIVAGAVIDLALGVVLLGAATGGRRPAYGAAAIAAVAVIAAIAGVQLDAHRMASGVFRTGTLLQDKEQVVAQFDGKTATISVTGTDGVFALRTNGKSEGAIRLGPGAPLDDELMMTLIGALPQFYAPQARQAAIIGFGTGLTTHVLLASPHLEAVDTIEIEPVVLAASRQFRPRTARAFEDPRGRVHFDDAKTYFAAQQKRYDVIISEPSNPWVSGVSGLFSREFYRNTRRYLGDHGLLFQWVHVYEMTPPLVATIIGALAENFEDYELWLANHGDMIVVAVPKGRLPRFDAAAFGNPALRAELERFNIRNLDDLLLHRIGGRSVLGPYYAIYRVPANSDFAPVLDLNAAFARFLRQQADDMPRLMEAPIPVLELFDRPRMQQPDPSRLSPGAHPGLRRSARTKQAELAELYLRTGKAAALDIVPPALASNLALLRAALIDCRLDVPPTTLQRALVQVAGALNPHLLAESRRALWKRLSASTCSSAAGARMWLSLFSAVAAEDATAITTAAGKLLQVDLSPELAPYAVAAHMTGLLLANDGTGALRTFDQHRLRLGFDPEAWDPVLRLLVGRASGR